MFPEVTARDWTPSLTALRAFEAMARTGRTTSAAEELGVTHSAVSRQVKRLEVSLGVKLFSGPKHRLELTDAGRELQAVLTSAFDDIAAAVARVGHRDRVLRIAAHASLSVKWLIPRLPSFAARQPNLRLELSELSPTAWSQRGAHGAVRLVRSERLDDPAVVPFLTSALGLVASPALAQAYPADALLAAPRLAVATHPTGWADWARLAGRALPPARQQPMAHLHFALDAAIAGLGVTVMSWPLAAAEVLAGRLVAPFGFEADGSVVALIKQPGSDGPAMAAFEAWLKEEGARAPAPPVSSSRRSTPAARTS